MVLAQWEDFEDSVNHPVPQLLSLWMITILLLEFCLLLALFFDKLQVCPGNKIASSDSYILLYLSYLDLSREQTLTKDVEKRENGNNGGRENGS